MMGYCILKSCVILFILCLISVVLLFHYSFISAYFALGVEVEILFVRNEPKDWNEKPDPKGNAQIILIYRCCDDGRDRVAFSNLISCQKQLVNPPLFDLPNTELQKPHRPILHLNLYFYRSLFQIVRRIFEQ